jgi:alpha-L-fucosidase
MFLHWSICSVKEMNISWPMIPGKNLGRNRIESAAERERIIREKDLEGTGKPWTMTPNTYWAMAKDFNPQQYDPEKWVLAAKAAGMKYMVLTARHHDGFAMWPSKFGNFGTVTYLNGRDLVRPFVDACHKNGMKVGLYYSGPDWHFEREYKDFFSYARTKTPEFPALDADLLPRTRETPAEELAAHKKAYEELVRGQVEELLTQYGRIDVLWFDGAPPTPNGNNVITIERIRELQPWIVINPRLHGAADFVTHERVIKKKEVAKTWAEFNNPWSVLWTYDRRADRFRSDASVLGDLTMCRALGMNYLLGVGPDKDGKLDPIVYSGLKRVKAWMDVNGASVTGVQPLPEGEKANVWATSAGSFRYLFAGQAFKPESKYLTEVDMLPPADATLELSGAGKVKSVTLLREDKPLEHSVSEGKLTVRLPAALRTKGVDVVRVELER